MSYFPETHNNDTRSVFFFFYNGTDMNSISSSVETTLDTSGIDAGWSISNNKLDDLVTGNEKVVGKSDVVFKSNTGSEVSIFLSTYSEGDFSPPTSQGYAIDKYISFQDTPTRTSYHAGHTDECLNIFGDNNINIHTYKPSYALQVNCNIVKGKSIVAGCII